jgi:hypothetical protein
MAIMTGMRNCEVPRVFGQAGLDGFRDHVHRACAELVFNLDEIEISEWEDRCTRRVIVPSAKKGQTIFRGVHQNLKHISVLACISAAGEYVTLFFVFPQVYPTVERRLKSEGLERGVDLIRKHGNKTYMSSQLFAEYISTVMLPYVDEL